MHQGARALQRHGMSLTTSKVKELYVFTACTDVVSILCTVGMH